MFWFFEKLPAEIRRDVGSRLNSRSLQSLSLANRTCRAAAAPSLYSSILLEIGSPRTLSADIAAFELIWDTAGIFRHVRSLDIQQQPTLGGFDWDALDEINDPRNIWRSGHDTSVRPPTGLHAPYAHWTTGDDSDWIPLANVLRRFTGLEHLIFDRCSQFPRCLLQALHTSLPNCKLEIYCFFLESPRRGLIDPYERELVTSPNLSSVHTRYRYLKENGRHKEGDLNDLATLDFVAGLAPALREVRMLHDWETLETFRTRQEDRMAIQPHAPTTGPARTWVGFPRTIPAEQGSLEILELTCDFDGKGIVTADCPARWAQATDFARLHQLRAGSVDGSAVRWLLNVPALDNLTRLQLGSERWTSSPLEELSDLLALLLPLRELDVTGKFYDRYLEALLLYHGEYSPLRELSFSSSGYALDPIQIIRLAHDCPNIESLTVCVRRSLGDRTEYEVYRGLGLFRRLRDLTLELDCRTCDNPFPDQDEPLDDETVFRDLRLPRDPSFSTFENKECPLEDGERRRPFRNGHVMKRLMNGAIDESLALSVWAAICAAKAQCGARLQSLNLFSQEDFFFDCYDMYKVFNVLQTAWYLTRNADDENARPEATPHPSSGAGGVKPKPSLRILMEKLWPGIFDEGRDWETFWRSQPLWSPNDEAAA